jgi:Ca-activated chloride channel family protein
MNQAKDVIISLSIAIIIILSSIVYITISVDDNFDTNGRKTPGSNGGGEDDEWREEVKKRWEVYKDYETVDDWIYNSGTSGGYSGSSSSSSSSSGNNTVVAAPSADYASDGASMGFSVGGAKDINNFRQNIENDYLPLPTDITYEGLFYDYYFDTGKKERSNELFYPSYTSAITRDPISSEEEYYMAVGLNSGMKQDDFKRKDLNLVIVLDISGSMSSSFNQYYYDKFGNKVELDEKDREKSKMQIATESIVALLDHLYPTDRFGMVLFNSNAYLARSLNYTYETDMGLLKEHILDISPKGGTHMSAGMRLGTDLFKEYIDVDQSVYENRIIFLTDAMPNIGETSKNGLFGMMKDNADNKTYTTFIGIGVDFNTELIEHIIKVRGANYYSVHSPTEFSERMDESFEYMVTPLVFGLELILDAPGYKIEKVYGSPEANESTGEIMKVNTLFPSKTVAGETKGGLVLLKLKKVSSNTELILRVSYENREGEIGTSEKVFEIPSKFPEYFDNNGVQKGILLSRYADLIKNWLIDERTAYQQNEEVEPTVTEETGIVVPHDLGQWERQSIPLQVSDYYKNLFSEFADYFEDEMNEIGDDTLKQELDILIKLSEYE